MFSAQRAAASLCCAWAHSCVCGYGVWVCTLLPAEGRDSSFYNGALTRELFQGAHESL